jgi:hypothetical protein
MSYSRWITSIWYTYWSASSEETTYKLPTKKLKYNQAFTICDFPSYDITYGELMTKDINTILQEVKEVYKDKNPTGYHRCWASIHNPDDELWKISKELFESDCVIFFSSVRWGAANMFYQKLIERLNWINNRYIPYGETNIIKDVTSGFICVGQHQYADDICQLQYGNHDYYGFKADKDLYWFWNAEDIEYDEETLEGYRQSYPDFFEEFNIKVK